ncbi:MAG TPA: hypothetical protein VET87_04205 [Rubrivivax sp.]|nr:hypothetical protein [Rubrivivax sp.]
MDRLPRGGSTSIRRTRRKHSPAFECEVALSGHGPENTTRLRRFAIGILNLRAKPGDSIASMARKLTAKTRQVFDRLLMTSNSMARPCWLIRR